MKLKSEQENPLLLKRPKPDEERERLRRLYPEVDPGDIPADGFGRKGAVSEIADRFERYKKNGGPVPGIKFFPERKGVMVSLKWSF